MAACAAQTGNPPTPALTRVSHTLAAPTAPAAVLPQKVLLGIDVLAQRDFSALRGKRVGLLTNQAGVNSRGVPTIDILKSARNVNLVALFAPEHGLYGDAKANDSVADRIDARTQLPVYSLYGKTRRPTAAMLDRIDVLVIDLQDLGVRSYTFISAMRYVMEECFRAGKEVMILDRPNPLGGLKVDGPMMDDALMSYVGAYRVPYVFGLTIGELALMAKGTPGWLDVPENVRKAGKLTVIPMSGWKRSMRWPDTGLVWKPTSPAIQDWNAAVGYSMTGLGCMMGGFSHGIGSEYPFRTLRYPGKTPEEVLTALRAEKIPGLDFRIMSLVQNGKTIRGVYVSVSDWNTFRPTEISFHLMHIAAQWNREAGKGNPFAKASADDALLFNKHTGSQALWDALVRHGEAADVGGMVDSWARDDRIFQDRSRKFWLYK